MSSAVLFNAAARSGAGRAAQPANAASAAATAACGAFQAIIKISPWAAPIRKELAKNLVLAQLTGELDPTTYKGIEAALAKGVTLWGPAPGVYGNMSKLELGANGKGKLHTLNIDDDGKATWSAKDATYTVGGDVGGAIGITVTSGGIALVEGEYTLETVAGAAGDDQAVAMLPGGGFIVLDTVVTPELAAEGLARDLADYDRAFGLIDATLTDGEVA